MTEYRYGQLPSSSSPPNLNGPGPTEARPAAGSAVTVPFGPSDSDVRRRLFYYYFKAFRDAFRGTGNAGAAAAAALADCGQDN